MQRQPDMTLRELRTHLLEVTEVDVSIPTVWRTMKRLGYTMKLVGYSYTRRSAVQLIMRRSHGQQLNRMTMNALRTRCSLVGIMRPINSYSLTRATSIG